MANHSVVFIIPVKIQLFNAAATTLDCISQIYYLNIALIFVLLRFRNKTKVVGITMIPTTLAK